MGPALSLTLDVDWAPDVVIDAVAETLVKHSVRATWFVTHRSPAIDRLELRPDLFELGIHPNLLPGSTHGAVMEDVLEHCLNLLPRAQCMRTHGLVQSSWLFVHVLAKTRIRCDSSLFLPDASGVCPLEHWWDRRRLLRIPYVWEDDVEMQKPLPCWRPEQVISPTPGLKVLTFHPVLIALNSAGRSSYAALKARRPSIQKARPSDIVALRHTGEGVGTMFDRVVERIARQRESLRLCDLVERYEREHHRSVGTAA